MNHIMLDLETLDTVHSAVVVSIGAVAFDPYSNVIGDQLYLELTDDMALQQERGRTVSANTARWWIQQDDTAKRVFAKPPAEGIKRVPTLDALLRFRIFVETNGGVDVELWGNGSDFDNMILGSLYDSFETPKPWSYSRNRCYRTMKNIGVGPRRPTEQVGVRHNALDDAVTQAKHLQEIFACLRPH